MYAASDDLIRAIRDYRWHLDGGYPVSASIKLVGDRFRLDSEERLILFRGMAASADASRRRALLTRDPANRVLVVDGYNQIFSIMHYRDGRPVFLSFDGLLRDVGSSHGRIPDSGRFDAAIEHLADALAQVQAKRVLAWFDAPVSGSAGHARHLQEALRQRAVTAEASICKTADSPLKDALDDWAVATSDSAVIDAIVRRPGGRVVFDAARFAIEKAFDIREVFDLGAHI